MSRFKQRRPRDDAPEETASAPAEVVGAVPVDDSSDRAFEAEAPATDGFRGRVGEHVETVLKAAEDAAERLVEEARARAARLTEEAERAHAEAVAAAEEVRFAAEEDAASRREAADMEAASVRAEAERDAATFAERTASRYEDLMNDTALAEDRLRRLVDGLRDVADRLDDLLEPAEDEEPSEPTDEALDEDDDTSLEEALDPAQPKGGSWNQ